MRADPVRFHAGGVHQRVSSLIVGAALLLAVSGGACRLQAQSQVMLNHLSSPEGLFSTNYYVTTAQLATSVIAPDSTNGYSFIGWTTNGGWTNGGGWVRTSGGAAINPISLITYSPTTITANYLPTTQDGEGQGVPDWWKMLYFGRTNLPATTDFTGDGFDLLTKYERGYDPRMIQRIVDGGISRRDSSSINVLLDLNMIFFAQMSDPPGIFSQQLPVNKNSAQATVPAPLATNGYSFTGWFDSSGGRIDSPDTAGVGSMTVGGVPTSVTARYLPTAQETNANGVPDWWELYYLNTLTNSADSQPTGDGFDLLTKYQRGYDPRMIQRIVDGGISRRDSASINVLLDLNMIFLAQMSDPPGIFSQQLPVNKNSALATVPAPLATNGYSFTGWFDSSGTRIDSPDTAGVGSLTVGALNTSVTAHYVPTAQETNTNGVPDWWELYYLNTLTNSAESQPTGDGFSLKTKYQRGYDPRMIHRIVDGGISRRSASSVNINLQIFERFARALIGGRLSNFYSRDPNAMNGQNFGTNAAPVVGDWNGDRLTDLMVFSGSGVRVFRNTGSEIAPDYMEVSDSFSGLNSTLSGNIAPAVAFGDWSGSGRPGLVIGGATGRLFFFPSTGSFSSPINGAPSFTLETGLPQTIPVFARFPGTNGLDLLVMTADGTVRDYAHTGNPSEPYSTFTENLLGTAVPGATGMTVADANGDGNPDMLVADSTGSIWEFRRASDGSFSLMTKVWGGSGVGFASGLTLAAIDPSGTGYPDLVAGTANGSLIYFRNPNIGRPSELSAQSGATSVQLSWLPNANSRLVGYNIYRSDGSTNNFTKIVSEAVNLPNYLDTNGTPGVTSYYQVTALANQYQSGSSAPQVFETDPSEIISATPGHVGVSLRSRRSNPSGYVRVPVSVENAMGIAGSGISLTISYDASVLTPAAKVDSNLPSVLLTGLTQDIQVTDNGKTASGTLTIAGSSGSLNPGKGKIFSLLFRVNPSAVINSTNTVRLESASFKSVSGASLTVNPGRNATVTISQTSQLGDVNGNGVVDSNDAATLLQVITSEMPAPSDVQMQAADLNADGVLDQQDMVLMRRLLDGLPLDKGR